MSRPTASLRLPRASRAWWLVGVAWFCATLPAAVWLDLLHAARASAAFSHQADLAAEVKTLLHRAASSPASSASLATDARPAKPLPAPAPADPVVRKFELPLLTSPAPLVVAATSASFSLRAPSMPAPRAEDVPHPPPRPTRAP